MSLPLVAPTLDILEHQLDDQENGTIESKEDRIGIDDSDIVDCDNDQVTDDSVPNYGETLAYRVVHVNGTTGSELKVPVTTQAPLQVLTTPINGQFYVIGSANDVFTTAQTRSVIAPRTTTTLAVETTPRTIKTSVKKRDDRRRATHNEVERRRRDKINNWITKLGKIIPDCNSPTSSNGDGSAKANYETQSKGGILSKACEYITELRTANQSMAQCVREHEKLRQENAGLKQLITQLKHENTHLKSQLPSTQDIAVDVHILP